MGDTYQRFTPLNLTSETLPSFNTIIDVNGLKSNPTFYQSAYVGSYVLNEKTRQRVQDRY